MGSRIPYWRPADHSVLTAHESLRDNKLLIYRTKEQKSSMGEQGTQSTHTSSVYWTVKNAIL